MTIVRQRHLIERVPFVVQTNSCEWSERAVRVMIKAADYLDNLSAEGWEVVSASFQLRDPGNWKTELNLDVVARRPIEGGPYR